MTNMMLMVSCRIALVVSILSIGKRESTSYLAAGKLQPCRSKMAPLITCTPLVFRVPTKVHIRLFHSSPTGMGLGILNDKCIIKSS